MRLAAAVVGAMWASAAISAPATAPMLSHGVVPDWHDSVRADAANVTVIEQDGVTRILFHRRAVSGAVNSRLQQEVAADGARYTVFDSAGAARYCYCAAGDAPAVAVRRFAARDVYYFVADPRATPPGADRPYQVAEIRADRTARYACTRQAPPRVPAAQIARAIAGDLSLHGADLAADRCTATTGDTR